MLCVTFGKKVVPTSTFNPALKHLCIFLGSFISSYSFYDHITFLITADRLPSESLYMLPQIIKSVFEAITNLNNVSVIFLRDPSCIFTNTQRFTEMCKLELMVKLRVFCCFFEELSLFKSFLKFLTVFQNLWTDGEPNPINSNNKIFIASLHILVKSDHFFQSYFIIVI